MSHHVTVFSGRFVLMGQAPWIFIAKELCDERQRAFLLDLSHRSLGPDGVDAIPESMTVPLHACDVGEVVEVCGIEVPCAQAMRQCDGFMLSLRHMKFHAQILVRQLAREAAARPWEEGFLAVKVDRDGLMQGWSRSEVPREPAQTV